MQEALVVFDDGDTHVEQASIEELGGTLQQRVVAGALHHDADTHAAVGGAPQHAEESAGGQEVGDSDHDVGPRPADRAQIGRLDRAPVQQVVARDEANLGRTRVNGGRDRRRQLAPLERGERDHGPQAAHPLLDLRHHRPGHAHRVVVAWRYLVRRVPVVDDVDAADEGDFAVDHRDLAVHAAQAAYRPPPQRRPVCKHRHAGVGEGAVETRGHVARAEAVDDNMHGNAAARRGGQGVSHFLRDGVVGIDIRFQEDLRPRRANRREQRGEVFSARAQQVDAVAAGVVASDHNASVARMARWSESADHDLRDSVETTVRPRT